jgi:hypothetical protein
MRLLILASMITMLAGGPVAAQDREYSTRFDDEAYPAPPAVTLLEGAGSLTRAAERTPLEGTLPLLDGDRIRTDEGRVEIRWPDGHVLLLDARSTLDAVTDTSLRLTEGLLRLRIVEPGVPEGLVIDTPSGAARFHHPGDFRLRAGLLQGREAVELLTVRGLAELTTDRERVRVSGGELALVRPFGQPYVETGVAADEPFDRWADAQFAEMFRARQHATHLPEPLHHYAPVLERHGSWAYEPSYGYVWYPSVAVSWRPYSYGSWGRMGRFGWTWIGLDPWAWPTHHYGRWGYSPHGRWYWIPGHRWGPAWVSWVVAPGYVGWSPLGWNNRPVFSFVAGTVYVGRAGRYYDQWAGWTVLPRDHFRPRVPVWRHMVDGRRLPAQEVSTFVTQRVPPTRAGHDAGSPSGGRYAVPRGGDGRGSGAGEPPRRVAVPRAGAPASANPTPGAALGVPAATPAGAASPEERVQRAQQRPGVRQATPRDPAQAQPAHTSPAWRADTDERVWRRPSGAARPDQARPRDPLYVAPTAPRGDAVAEPPHGSATSGVERRHDVTSPSGGRVRSPGYAVPRGEATPEAPAAPPAYAPRTRAGSERGEAPAPPTYAPRQRGGSEGHEPARGGHRAVPRGEAPPAVAPPPSRRAAPTAGESGRQDDGGRSGGRAVPRQGARQ